MGGAVITDAEFLPEFGVVLTAVGMVEAEEGGNAIARLFILIVTSNRAARPRLDIRRYCRGEG